MEKDYTVRREDDGTYSVYWIGKYGVYKMIGDLDNFEKARRYAGEMQAEDNAHLQAAGDMTTALKGVQA